MNTESHFPAISPSMARDRFLIQDDSWEDRFRPDFNQFIIAPLAYARPVIKLPLPPGRTSNHVLFLVTHGQIEMTIGHTAYTLSANELVVIPAAQIFSLATIQEDTTGFMCFFSNELYLSAVGEKEPDFMKLTSNPLISLTDTQTGHVGAVCARLTVEYTENGATQTDLIRPYLLALLSEINRAYIGSSSAKLDAGARLVQQFMDVVSKHVRQQRLVTDYASQLNVTPNHLNKVVKARTGKSPSVWIDERIVLEAKVLLFQSTLTVAQVAAELGFDDQSNFGKVFRRYARVSPTAFRRQCIGPND
ncbi:helix-turn-helix domain-containing protein [Spirosoma jeollabukense]